MVSGIGVTTWDPTTLLTIHNAAHANDLTCVGYAPTQKRRCQNPVARDNRAAAYTLLNKLSRMDPSKEDLKPILTDLAERTLCKRYHVHTQIDSMVRQWLQIIEKQFGKSSRRPPAAATLTLGIDRAREVRVEFRADTDFFARPLARVSTSRTQRAAAAPAQQQQRVEAEAEAERVRREAEARARARAAETRRQERIREERERELKAKAEEEEEERLRHEAQAKQEEERRRREAREEEERLQREAQEEEERLQREAREKEEKRTQELARRQRELDAPKQRLRRRPDRQQRDDGQAWEAYNEAWKAFEDKRSTGQATVQDLRWPVESGSFDHVTEDAVARFYQPALVGKDVPARMTMWMRETVRWHEDKRLLLQATADVKASMRMVTRVIIKLKSDTKILERRKK